MLYIVTLAIVTVTQLYDLINVKYCRIYLKDLVIWSMPRKRNYLQKNLQKTSEEHENII